MSFLFINPNRIISGNNIWSVVNSVNPPLGIATIASVLEGEGLETDIIDAAALGLDISGILSRIGSGVEFVGITATTPEIESARAIAKAIRSSHPRIKIVMGGVHPTVFHTELVGSGTCDMVVRGEGEKVMLDIARRTPLTDIPNLTWKTAGGEVTVNDERENFVALDELPFPLYAKLPMKKYRSALGAARRSPSIGMITSRGCPGKCTFCFSGMFGKKIRFMSVDRVIEHISYLKSAFGIREISFYDDTFTANRGRVEELCRRMISEKTDISWSCFARVDAVNPDLLKQMKEAGCHQICYGFESVDENILKAINKRVSSSSYADIIRWMGDAGMDIRGAFMLGNRGETEESIRKTVDYSKKAGIQFAVYNITTPFPGTALFDWAQDNGLLKHTDWRLYDLAHPVMELPSILPETLQECYHRAYREFYLRPAYILERLSSIRTKDDFLTYWQAFRGMLSMLAGGNK